MRLYLNGKFKALPANIRLGWKRETLTNTLAYYSMKLFTSVKSFTAQALGFAPGAIKLFGVNTHF